MSDLSATYQLKTDKEHILSNPDTYTGSMDTIETLLYIWNGNEEDSKRCDDRPGCSDENLLSPVFSKQ